MVTKKKDKLLKKVNKKKKGVKKTKVNKINLKAKPKNVDKKDKTSFFSSITNLFSSKKNTIKEKAKEENIKPKDKKKVKESKMLNIKKSNLVKNKKLKEEKAKKLVKKFEKEVKIKKSLKNSNKNLKNYKFEKNDKERFIKTGIKGFDNLFDNKMGIPSGAAVLVEGGPGSGKTLFCLATLNELCKKGKKGLYMSFEESEEQLIGHMEGFNWKAKDYIKKGFNKYVISESLLLSYLNKIEGIVCDTNKKFVPKEVFSFQEVLKHY